MNKEQIIEKLKELGIDSTNAHPKSSFLTEQKTVVVALYEREMKGAFFFYNNYDKKVYKTANNLPLDEYTKDPKSDKYLIPLSWCTIIWEDKPFQELEDEPYRDMTLRQYACIHLRVPNTGLSWLNELISQSVKVYGEI